MNTSQRTSSRLSAEKRLDYKALSETGRRVLKKSDNYSQYTERNTSAIDTSSDSDDSNSNQAEVTSSISSVVNDNLLIGSEAINELTKLVDTCHLQEGKMEQEAKALERRLASVADDIFDHIEEHEITDTDIVEDIDNYVSKVEKMRADYRKCYRDLEGILLEKGDTNEKVQERCEVVLRKVKEYVVMAKKNRVMLRQNEANEQLQKRFEKEKIQIDATIQKNRAIDFLLSEVSRMIGEQKNEFKIPVINFDDEQLKRRDKDLPANKAKVECLSRKLQHVLEIISDSYPDSETVIDTTTQSYDDLIKDMKKYEKFIKIEMQKREAEIIKEDKFKSSALNIKLAKFKGYDSELDFFTFKSQFEKLHLKDIPITHLPDLLKNNYLQEPALSLVRRLDTVADIWDRLQKAYGDPRVMLMNKLSDVKKVGPLWKLRDSERLKAGLAILLNSMAELLKLSREHGIEQKLYHGEALDIIYSMMGDKLVTQWLSSKTNENPLAEHELWKKLMEFLEKELSIQEEKSLIKHRFTGNPIEPSKEETYKRNNDRKRDTFLAEDGKESIKCSFCGEIGHSLSNGPNKTKIVQYFSCKKFVEMPPSQRFKELFAKGYCFQCLFPGAKNNEGKHCDGSCQNDYACKHESHARFQRKKHVLLCQEHCDLEQNVKTFEEYKSRFILPLKGAKDFSKNMKLAFMSSYATSFEQDKSRKQNSNEEDIVEENGIYMFQRICVDDKPFTIFFDTGCSDFVSCHKAVQKIKGRCQQNVEGPIELGGVGNCKVVSPYGIKEVKLPLDNGKDAVFFGICLDAITAKFPLYPLKGEVERDIHEAYSKSGGDVTKLPSLPKFVGGNIDFMIGAKYMRYHPTPVFTMPSGLTIYLSPFKGFDGTRGVIGGPHKVFTAIQRQTDSHHTSYLTQQYELFQMGYQINPDNHLLGIKLKKDFDIYDDVEEDESNPLISDEVQQSSFTNAKKQKQFQEAENAGSEINFRCVDCRSCSKCKHGEQIEMISIREEVEQSIIDKSVTVDVQKGETIACLPFIDDPLKKLAPNKSIAMSVYQNQLKKLKKCEKDKLDVISSEKKLQDLGHVEFVKNLPPDIQKLLQDHPIQHFIAWLSVWNPNSISTPCRLVFHGSLPTPSSHSLNDILAKGRNNLNKLVEIFVRWRCYTYAYHSDVQKMYNAVKLIENHWCFQRYIWQKDLDPNVIPEEKIVKTLIYGIKSSGNQAECALRKVAKLYEKDYPEICQIIHSDIYVDDCLTGQHSDISYQRADELGIVLKNGGFNLKGFTFSGEPPLDNLSEDGESINCAGLKWFSKSDELQLDIGTLNFSKKVRGKKKTSDKPERIPERLTRCQVVGKVAEVFDLCGRFTPLIAHMKLDLHDLVIRKLDWDDVIPDDLKHVWVDNMEMIEEIGRVRFKRVVVPTDAASTDINTIDAGDASTAIACAAIYVRFPRRNGDYSCQLIFARSKLLRENPTQPRAELSAAYLNTHTAEVVRRSLGKYYKYSTKLTDSKIALSWISNKDIPLKQWVRNRVIEICRFSGVSSWMHVKSENMVADLGTRRGATLKDVLPNSDWDIGLPWMTKDVSCFPGTRYEDVKLSPEEQVNVEKEIVSCKKMSSVPWYEGQASCHVVDSDVTKCNKERVPEDVGLRYKFSNYLVDPNRHRFRDVIRIMAIVLRFVRNCRKKCVKDSNNADQKVVKKSSNKDGSSDEFVLSDDDLSHAKSYYYERATKEIKEFTKKKKYENISTQKDDVLYYTGRILPEQKVNSVATLSGVMKDLSTSTFVVPLIDKHSPLAYSIVTEVHWHDKIAKHAGIETVLRFTLQYAFILEGREIVKKIKGGCERCRYIHKRTIDVTMGPVSQFNLMIAPAFYVSQIDIAGPFKAYSLHNKRTTIKIWYCVFCCATTRTVNIKVLEDYSTSSFFQSFIRFACEVGYPKIMCIDEGSQLVRGCQTMGFCFKDVRSKLSKEVNVEFECCPVGGHNFHGLVERKIRHIKESLEKSLEGERLSILQWETMGSQVANCINDLPIAANNVVADLENIDLLTPNRLRLGRNNQRSPVGPMWVTGKPDKFIETNKQIFDSWFEVWLITCVPQLILKPKWFSSDKDISVGDIVLFLKKEGELNSTYQYGRVTEAPKGRDGKIRKVTVTYRNYNEDVDRMTKRAVREIVMIHPIDEINITEELGRVANAADVMYIKQMQGSDFLKSVPAV